MQIRPEISFRRGPHPLHRIRSLVKPKSSRHQLIYSSVSTQKDARSRGKLRSYQRNLVSISVWLSGKKTGHFLFLPSYICQLATSPRSSSIRTTDTSSRTQHSNRCMALQRNARRRGQRLFPLSPRWNWGAAGELLRLRRARLSGEKGIQAPTIQGLMDPATPLLREATRAITAEATARGWLYQGCISCSSA